MITLFGLAGSGKGTQGRALAEIFGWRWLSVGEAIRQTGEYDEIINGGNMIPDEDVVKMMGKQIEKAEMEGFDLMLDGYPRDKMQTEWILKTCLILCRQFRIFILKECGEREMCFASIETPTVVLPGSR